MGTFVSIIKSCVPLASHSAHTSVLRNETWQEFEPGMLMKQYKLNNRDLTFEHKLSDQNLS